MAGMDMSSIASFVEGGSGLAKIFFGSRQASRANKEKAELWANYPIMPIPKEYESYLKTYQALAGGNKPGYNLGLSNIQQNVGQMLGAAKEGAMSSAQYQKTVSDINQGALKEISQYDLDNAKYVAEARKGAAEASKFMGDVNMLKWANDYLHKWNTQMMDTQSKYNEGMGNVWGGLDTFVQSGYNFADSGGGSAIGGMMG